MGETVRDVLTGLAARAYKRSLSDVVGTYRFEIDGVGTWLIRVDGGVVTVREGTGPAEAVVGCTRDEALRLIRGEHRLLTAAMRGEVRLSGRLDLWKAFDDMFPALLEATNPPGPAP
jgi:putative sterol carrier protein